MVTVMFSCMSKSHISGVNRNDGLIPVIISVSSSLGYSIHHLPSQSHTGSAAGRGPRLGESQAPRWAQCHAGGGMTAKEEGK